MYYVPQISLIAVIQKQMRLHGVRLDDLHFNESAPDSHLTIQGEYWNGFERYMMFSMAQLAMKDALALPLDPMIPRDCDWKYESEGIETDRILQHFMDGNSWDDFQLLRDRYPDHIIEFSTYDCNLGILPYHNTIIWEVRKY